LAAGRLLVETSSTRHAANMALPAPDTAAQANAFSDVRIDEFYELI